MSTVVTHSVKNKRSLTILIWLNILIAFTQSLVATYQIINEFILLGADLNRFREDLPSAGSFLLGGVVHAILVYGLYKSKRWSGMMQNIMAIPYLFTFPFGTLYAIWAWIVMNRYHMTTIPPQQSV